MISDNLRDLLDVFVSANTVMAWLGLLYVASVGFPFAVWLSSGPRRVRQREKIDEVTDHRLP